MCAGPWMGPSGLSWGNNETRLTLPFSGWMRRKRWLSLMSCQGHPRVCPEHSVTQTPEHRQASHPAPCCSEEGPHSHGRGQAGAEGMGTESHTEKDAAARWALNTPGPGPGSG